MQTVILEQLQTLRTEQREGFASMRSEFNQRIDRLVTSEAFTAEQRRVDEKFSSQGKEIADERASREAAFAAQQGRQDRLATNFKWLATSLILPLAIFIYGIVQDAGAGV